jgi:hypothetical protein
MNYVPSQVVHTDLLGTAFGLLTAIQNCGLFLVPMMIGWFHSLTGSFTLGNLFFASLSTIGLVLAIVLHRSSASRILTLPSGPAAEMYERTIGAHGGGGVGGSYEGGENTYMGVDVNDLDDDEGEVSSHRNRHGGSESLAVEMREMKDGLLLGSATTESAYEDHDSDDNSTNDTEGDDWDV